MSSVITEADFEAEVLNSDKPVLVDFWATWCGPCKMIAPVLDQISTEMAGTAKIAKVDVDTCLTLAGRYGIKALPTMLFFKDGEVKDTVVGVTSKENLVARLKALI